MHKTFDLELECIIHYTKLNLYIIILPHKAYTNFYQAAKADPNCCNHCARVNTSVITIK